LVRPESFDAAKTADIASEINVLNGRLRAAKRTYLLVGPGRWGSADPWLGVPVQWRDISGVGAIVELQNELLHAEPSQGSHFFQNITSLGIPYLTIKETGTTKCSSSQGEDCVDWNWFMAQNDFEDGKYVRHIRLERPFVMKCDGKKEMAVLYMQNCEEQDGQGCSIEFEG
ncbi:MAG: phosphoenolpyruvate synthase/pyruvate phosphate dikinase, partial [Desulfocapsa sp.]